MDHLKHQKNKKQLELENILKSINISKNDMN